MTIKSFKQKFLMWKAMSMCAQPLLDTVKPPVHHGKVHFLAKMFVFNWM